MNTPEDDQANRVKAALFAGNKIEAIKLWRTQTGQGLAESKQAVEKLEAELRASAPEQFTKPQGKGCMVALLVGGTAIGALLYSTLS